MEPVYLDNNATTPLAPEVLAAMQPYLTGWTGNPSSSHRFGRAARQAIERSRRQIAAALAAEPAAIFFTSGATEANNQLIFANAGPAGSTIAVAQGEHSSVREPFQQLRQRGYSVLELPTDASGVVQPTIPLNHLSDDQNGASATSRSLRLLACQLANGETGCIQPLADRVRQWRDQIGPELLIHCDAVQAVGKIPVHFEDLDVTSLVFSGHKIHGPMGIAAVLVRPDRPIRPLLYGGHQQQGFRPGTEPVPAIVGLGAAIELAVQQMAENHLRMAERRDRLEQTLCAQLDAVYINGLVTDTATDTVQDTTNTQSPRIPYTVTNRLPNTTNISFVGAKAEALLMALDLAGVCCSAGSACASGSLEPSPTLLAMGLTPERYQSAIRFSLSRYTTDADLDQAIPRIIRAVRQVRGSLTFPRK